MQRFITTIDTNSTAFAANRAAMVALIEAWRAVEQRAETASHKAQSRFAARGQLLPRERVALLLDQGAPFVPIANLAGYGHDTADLTRSVAGAGIIAGIGMVSGVRVMVSASDSGIEAGALQPFGLDKQVRVQALALENKLPYLQLVESAGANLMRYRVGDFIRGGALFRNLALHSAAGLPVITVTHGSSTAGGAYQTGLSDYIIMVRGRTRAFLAGPPLLKAATGEIATEEQLGGAEMHTSISGLGDYLAEDDREAIGIARQIIKNLDWNKGYQREAPHFAAPALPTEDLVGLMPADLRQPVDMREIVARLVDGSEYLEFSARYGAATLCLSAHLGGIAVGIITNNGPLDPAGANKVTHFIQACCQAGTPLIYLQNTTGFFVGRAFEEAGMIKHGSKMIQAVASASVPQITIHCGASYGAGNYAMAGRGFAPRFAFSWPNARTAVMGGEQAAETMAIVQEATLEKRGQKLDPAMRAKMKAEIIGLFEGQADALTLSAQVLDDGIIDPRDTRPLLIECLRICAEAETRQLRPLPFSVARP